MGTHLSLGKLNPFPGNLLLSCLPVVHSAHALCLEEHKKRLDQIAYSPSIRHMERTEKKKQRTQRDDLNNCLHRLIE